MKIALVGSAPSSVRMAPYNNPEWRIWGCSPGVYGVAPNVDVWFELHRYEPGQPWFSPEYCQWLAKFPGPVYMAEKVPSIPNSQVLPVDHLVEKYGPYFFTSSLSWMFAMAMEAGATTIGLWGVDMSASEEYGYQRAGCQYFALLAKSKGIEVGVSPESDLLRPPPMYGISELDHTRIKILARRRELQMRLQNAQAQVANSNNEAHFLQGALDDLLWNENTWTGDLDTRGRKFVEPPLVPALVDLKIVGEET